MDIVTINQKSWKHFGSPAGCVHLGAADIGIARSGKRRIYTTWGRNLNLDQAERLCLPVVRNEDCVDPEFEVVLSGRILAAILAGMAVNSTLYHDEKR